VNRERVIDAMIVDDERLARQRMRRFLAEQAEVRIVAECGNGYEAIRAVQELEPDLLFLDIEMPEVDGFAVIDAVRDLPRLPYIVFVTAFDKYAVRAFQVRAIDYLLKPVERERLAESVARARGTIAERGDHRAVLAALLEDLSPNRPRRFTVRGTDRIYFVAHADVDWIEAAGNYVRLHAGKETHLIRTTMHAAEEALGATPFVRIHRSTMVNAQRIKELMPTFSGDYIVVLRNGERLTLSRTYRGALDRLTDGR